MKKRFPSGDEPEDLNESNQQGMSFSRDLRRPVPAPAKKVIAEHTVAAGETLGEISLKYFKSAAKDKWMVIYEANKGVIGDNPGTLKIWQVLKIPELPG